MHSGAIYNIYIRSTIMLCTHTARRPCRLSIVLVIYLPPTKQRHVDYNFLSYRIIYEISTLNFGQIVDDSRRKFAVNPMSVYEFDETRGNSWNLFTIAAMSIEDDTPIFVCCLRLIQTNDRSTTVLRGIEPLGLKLIPHKLMSNQMFTL